MCYGIVDDGAFMPIARLVDVEEYLDYAANRVVPDLEIRHALEKMFSSSATPGAESALLACEDCGINLPAAFEDITKNVFTTVVQDFQDAYTLNVRQLMKCCVAQITPDGRLIPFCAYNTVGYREQVRAELSGAAVPAVVPNAEPLQPILQLGPHGSMTAGASGDGTRDTTNIGRKLDR